MPTPPRPSDQLPCTIGCTVPRPFAAHLQRIAAARQVSLSTVMREGLLKAYAPDAVPTDKRGLPDVGK